MTRAAVRRTELFVLVAAIRRDQMVYVKRFGSLPDAPFGDSDRHPPCS